MAEDQTKERTAEPTPLPQPIRPNPSIPETHGMGWPYERKPKDRKKKPR